MRRVWHAKVRSDLPQLQSHRFKVIHAWRWGDEWCDKQLDKASYRVPISVDAYIDRPTAEAALDLYWANSHPAAPDQWRKPDVLVLLTRRHGESWAGKRAQRYGAHMNLPIDRPCSGRALFMTNATVAGRLLDLHAELLKCITPPQALIEVDVKAPDATHGLMSRLSWRLLGRGLPAGSHGIFPRPTNTSDMQPLRATCDATCMGSTCAGFLLKTTCESLASRGVRCGCRGCCTPAWQVHSG